ncbi:MAG: DNA mismatch repair protein MutS [Candidatus Melainabacteria bacterium]
MSGQSSTTSGATAASATTYGVRHSAMVNPELATPMVRQFIEVKAQYPGILLLYRMGDFYETFLEDALIAARVLEITLTGREAGACGRIPMAGIPVKAADSYIQKLLGENFKVAICEQMAEEPGRPAVKGLMTRQVVRVLSSGTVTEPAHLKSDENNYLAALALLPGRGQSVAQYGLAYCDISTGAFYTTTLSEKQLTGELDRIRPVELLLSGRQKKTTHSSDQYDEWLYALPAGMLPVIQSQYAVTPVAEDQLSAADLSVALDRLFHPGCAETFSLADVPAGMRACGMIARYLERQFPTELPRFEGIRRYSLDEAMVLHAAARRNLELTVTAKNRQYEGSLLWVLNRTQTSMGARLLRHWVSQPLVSLPEITSRHDSVEELVNHPVVREGVRHILPDVYDLERLSTKLANATVQPRDLIALRQSIARLPELSTLMKRMTSFYLTRLQEFPAGLFKLVALIDQAIDENPPLTLKEGGIIRTGFHQELDQLRSVLENHEAWLRQYEEQERETTGIKTLRLSFNQAFGYFIEISRANSRNAPPHYERKQTLTNAERFTTPILKAHEGQVLDAQARVFELEYDLFIQLRQQLLQYADLLKDCAHRVAALDVLQSLATVAVEQHYTRPVMDESVVLTLHQGRHPVVEKMLPLGQFVANDCQLSAADDEYVAPRLQLITGPNMAGKSTYMRQVALIVLMAQMGSFVPAAYARIGVVDGIFTRVGAVDDLASGQSTFMVEMNETAQILFGATQRSLVLLDEVGRGTSTYDGISIAWAVCDYLINTMGCRTLFATHYHELNTLEAAHARVQNVRVVVSEDGHDIAFLHTVEPGAAQKSYGIQVAKMAGLPIPVIDQATSILRRLEESRDTTARHRQTPSSGGRVLLEAEPAPQLRLF